MMVTAIFVPNGEDVSTSINITPSQTVVSPNQKFTVSINLESTDQLAGGQFNLSFNPAVMLIDSEIEGTFFKQSGNSTYYMAGSIDNMLGTVKNTAIAITTPGGSSTGSGTMVVFNCTALGEGFTNFSLSNVIGGDISAHAVSIGGTIVNNVEVKNMALTFNGSVSNQYVAGEVVTLKITRPDSVVETITTPTLADKTFTATYNNNVVAGNYTILASILADAIYKSANVTATFAVSLQDRTITLNVV
jgi:hypothetical protein